MLAARKHATLVVASFAVLAAFALAGSAGGVPGKKDREALSAPTNVRVTAATPSSVSLAWDPSQEGALVAGYWVYVDEVRAEISGSEYTGTAVPVEVSGTAYTALDLDCGRSIGIWIVAFDRKTNRSPAARATVSTAACSDTQPPTAPTGFHQAATSESAVMLEWKASSDDVGVVGYGVYRNQLPVQSPSEPAATLSGLVCGSWVEFQIDAVDAAGNRSPRRSAWVQTASCAELPSPPKPTVPVPPAPPTLPAPPSPPTLPGPPSDPTVPPPTLPALPSPPSIDALAADSTPPSQPASLAISAATRTSVTLSWGPSSDDLSVAGYDVYRNGTKMASVASTSFTLGALTCGTPFWSGVEAFDAAGNRSPRVRVNPTTSACPLPPANLAFSGATTNSVSLSWSPSTDELGIAGYDVYRNGTKMASVTSTSSTQGGLACGTSYWFGVEALDTAGNRSERKRVNPKTPDCPRQPLPPTVPPPPAPDAPTDNTPPTQPANLAVNAATRTSVSLTWSPSTDNVDVSGYRVYVNGAPAANPTLPTALVSALTCGTAFPFEVDAVDAAGNRSPRARITASTAACADTQAPTAPSNVSASSRSATSIALTWSASSDNVGVTGYGLYRGGSSVGSASTTTAIFSGLTCNTNYTLAVDAVDAGGNRSAKATVMVSTTACPDTTAPSAPTGLAASSIAQTSLALQWNASTDNVGVAGYDVFRDGTKMATVTSTSAGQAGLACATSYWFGVEAFDAGGNRSARISVNATTTACAAPPPAPAGVFYVHPNGSDSANGSQSSPWRTLKKGCDTVTSGTISVAAGTYTESGTCVLRSKTSIVGAGAGATVIRAASSAVNPLILVQGTTGPQTISDLKLDGQSRTTSDFGMKVLNVAGLTITRLDVTGFKNTQNWNGGGISVLGATDFELSHSTLSNNASETATYCTGDLGLGDLNRALIHDLKITSPQGYNVKMTANYSVIRDTEIYNNDFDAASASCSTWNTLGVELWSDAQNSSFHHNRLNRTLSLPEVGNESPLPSGYRWRIHNNHFTMPGGSNYAIEAGLNGSIVDHNYFEGGLYPFGQFHAGHVAEENDIHHNVFDNQHGPTAVWHEVASTTRARFHENTVILRQGSWRDGVFSFGNLQGYTGSTIDIRENIFYSTAGVGDKLGLGLGSATVDRNAFWNLTARGQNAISQDPGLALSAGFPNAYIPSSGTVAGLGAFADGSWSVGPQ